MFIDTHSWKTFSVFFGHWYFCELFTLMALHDHSLFKRYGFKRFRIWSLCLWSAAVLPCLVHLVFKPLFSLSGHECRCGAVVWSSYLTQVNKQQSCFEHTLGYSNGVLKNESRLEGLFSEIRKVEFWSKLYKQLVFPEEEINSEVVLFVQ